MLSICADIGQQYGLITLYYGTYCSTYVYVVPLVVGTGSGYVEVEFGNCRRHPTWNVPMLALAQLGIE